MRVVVRRSPTMVACDPDVLVEVHATRSSIVGSNTGERGPRGQNITSHYEFMGIPTAHELILVRG